MPWYFRIQTFGYIFTNSVNMKRHNNKLIYLFLLYFVPVSLSPQHGHSWVVEFQSHSRSHRNTRLSTYNMFNALRYTPCFHLLLIDSYLYSSYFSLPSSLSADSNATYLEPASSIPSCFNHLLSTQAPDLRTVFSQRSRIGHVAMYCATVLYVFRA